MDQLRFFLMHSYPRGSHRVVDRGILSHISDMNFQFWAVLGRRGCREKNPSCHKYDNFEGSFFMFSWKIVTNASFMYEAKKKVKCLDS